MVNGKKLKWHFKTVTFSYERNYDVYFKFAQYIIYIIFHEIPEIRKK